MLDQKIGFSEIFLVFSDLSFLWLSEIFICYYKNSVEEFLFSEQKENSGNCLSCYPVHINFSTYTLYQNIQM